MVDTVLAVAKALLSMQETFRKSDGERRKQIADYFQSISHCLEGIAHELSERKLPHAKCAELQTYATELPAAISDEIGIEKAGNLAAQLSTAAGIKGTLLEEAEGSQERTDKISKLEEAAGVFRALAFSIAAAGPISIPPGRRNLPYLWLIGVLAIVVVGIYFWRFRVVGDKTCSIVNSPDQSHAFTPSSASVSMDEQFLATRPAWDHRPIDFRCDNGNHVFDFTITWDLSVVGQGTRIETCKTALATTPGTKYYLIGKFGPTPPNGAPGLVGCELRPQ
jgi:hypothetical protein